MKSDNSHKHIIYIPDVGQKYVLSQQLAHAFARHNYEHQNKDEEKPIIIAQYGSNLKPLELVSPKDELQIMFTPITDLHAPMHTQTSANDLLSQVPILIEHLVQDGLNTSGCTIQLYTLEYNGQDTTILKEIANQLVEAANFNDFTIEWHVIPKLKNLSHEQLSKIFQPQITCQATVYAVTGKNGKSKIVESKGSFYKTDDLH